MSDSSLPQNHSALKEQPTVTQDLSSSDAAMHALLESASDAVVVVDRESRIAWVNARAEEMFGYHRRELFGQSLCLLLPERFHERHQGHCSGYLRHPSHRPMGAAAQRDAGELYARRRDGCEFPVEVSLSFAEVEGVLYAMSFVRDASERLLAEQASQSHVEQLEQMVARRTRGPERAQDRARAQLRRQRDLELARHDLELAQQVQASLLPRDTPELEGYELAAESRPARYVSGDFCDVFSCDGPSCYLVLADIAGKGVPAALLTSTARTLIRAEAEHHDSPAAILSNVNHLLYPDLAHIESFITVLAARLDARLGRLTYASAGHAEVLWWQDARRACQRLPATGLPLGIEREGDLGETSIALRPGDVLLFYSDGVTEAENAAGALYGLQRLERLLAGNAALPAGSLAQEIVASVDAFRGREPRSDDLTLIVLKVLPRTVALTTPATLEHLDEITGLVHQAALAYGSEFAYQIELATCEVVTNAMRHACHFQGEVRMRLVMRPDEMQVDLYDDGDACDLDALPVPELGELREGGYGLHVVRSLVDELTYAANVSSADEPPSGNHWRLVKRTS